jgi:hypothetical protein
LAALAWGYFVVVLTWNCMLLNAAESCTTLLDLLVEQLFSSSFERRVFACFKV